MRYEDSDFFSSSLFLNVTGPGGIHDGYFCGRDQSNKSLHDDNSFLMNCLPTLLLSSTLPGLLSFMSWVFWGMYFTSSRSRFSRFPLPPGSMGLPIFGETLSFIFKGTKFFTRRHELYGRVYKTHLLGVPTVRVMGADNMRKVLLGENTLVTSFWPVSVRLLLGSDNITMSVDKKHRFLRKAVLKAFNHESLSSYTHVLQQEVRQYIHSWCQRGHVLVYGQCRSLAFSSVSRALLGLDHLKGHQMDQLVDLFWTFSDNLFSLPYKVPGWGLSKGLRARKLLLDKIDDWMEIKQRLGTEATSSRPVALETLMTQLQQNDEHRLTHEQQKDIWLELMFTGHFTVASAATSLLYLLARNPRVIQRVLDELEAHRLRESQADDLTFDQLSQLTYTGHVVKEVLRFLPPVGGGFRKVIRTFELDGYQIPEGWTLSFSIRETQAFSELFANGDQFQPERWEQLLQPGQETFHFLPFGRGARSCVGQEFAKLLLKILTVEMCRSCHWRQVNEEVKMKSMPVPHPADGLPMQVTLQRPPGLHSPAAVV